MSKRKTALIIFSLFLILACIFAGKKIFSRDELKLNFDPDYYWSENSFDNGTWFYEKTYSGFEYFLYIPPKFRNDRHNENAKIPLIVTFHGSSSKGSSLGRFGRLFIDKKLQSKIECAVLVILARGEYFCDCHDVSLLIQNILIKNECLDKTRIIGFGHSQGAEFVVKLACHEPSLFKGVVSGSGYYKVSFRELMSILPVSFYWGTSKNDKGIYEQSEKPGKMLAKFCKNSIYAEYETRGHFWVELNDVSPKEKKPFIDWLLETIEG